MRSSLGLMAVMLLAAAIGVLAAHSQSQTVAAPAVQSTPAATLLPPPNTVYMVGSSANSSGPSYVPTTLKARVGQKVTWINQDSAGHTATADGGEFNSDVLNAGQHYSWTARRPGAYAYSDYTQSNLQGTIVVSP